MNTVKVAIGTGRKGKTTYLWLDGTKDEIVEKLTNRFRVYTTRPTKDKTATVAKPKTTKTTTKTAPTPEAVAS